MIIDEKGKLFGKVSIVDLLFVLIVVVAIIGAVFMVNKIKSGKVLTENKGIVQLDDSMNRIQVKMLVKEIRQITVDSMAVGDKVFESETGKYLGEITAIDTEPSTSLLTDIHGHAAYKEVPGKFDMTLTIVTPGKQTDGGFYTANNQHLVYGSQYGIKTAKIQTIPQIAGLELLPKETK